MRIDSNVIDGSENRMYLPTDILSDGNASYFNAKEVYDGMVSDRGLSGA